MPTFNTMGPVKRRFTHGGPQVNHPSPKQFNRSHTRSGGENDWDSRWSVISPQRVYQQPPVSYSCHSGVTCFASSCPGPHYSLSLRPLSLSLLRPHLTKSILCPAPTLYSQFRFVRRFQQLVPVWGVCQCRAGDRTTCFGHVTPRDLVILPTWANLPLSQILTWVSRGSTIRTQVVCVLPADNWAYCLLIRVRY